MELLRSVFVGFLALFPASVLVAQACEPSWVPTFGRAPGSVSRLAVFDDGSGSGPQLYAGGTFGSPGVARRDGADWISIGTVTDAIGHPGSVDVLASLDDGSGPGLYAAGNVYAIDDVIVRGIARWDGTSWSALADGADISVRALAVFDDSGGPALFAGGTTSLRKWDGASWSTVASFSSSVNTMVAFDDGKGPALYVGGAFTVAGGVPANRIARWDGASWTALGSGLDGGVFALTVFDGALVAGGTFTTAGGLPASRIARWGGASWQALGSGVSARVDALRVFDDGSGPALFAAGIFTSAGGLPAGGIAAWDGTSWSTLGSEMDVWSAGLEVHDDGSGPALYARGAFTTTPGVTTQHLARWDGGSWERLGSGLDGDVHALATFDDGSGGGPRVYAGGSFTVAGNAAAPRIARWNGAGWSALGNGVGGVSSPTVEALAVFDDESGGGPALYAGGDFTTAGGATARRIARWDGTSWSPLGNGMPTGRVKALVVHDDGSGPALYAGGTFMSAGGVFVSRIARWNGTIWSSLGGGMNEEVQALAVFDDGSGPALYAGGFFSTAGGVAVEYIARWDGAAWSNPPGSHPQYANVQALTVFDDGNGGGPALYAGCGLAGFSASAVMKFDGASWSQVGGNMSNSSASTDVEALAVFDDGSGAGPALYAGGDFFTVGGVPAWGLARWNSTSWTPVGDGLAGSVYALAALDGVVGPGRSLVAGGSFGIGSSGDTSIARLQSCDDTPPTIAHPAAVRKGESFSGPPGEVVTFAVGASDDFDPSPSVVCDPPSGSFFPHGTTLVTCTATDAAGNQSTAQFPVIVHDKAKQTGF